MARDTAVMESDTELPASCDVAVVGGGVVGLSCAYYLARAGLEVAVLERGVPGGLTSGACDGNLLLTDKAPGYDTELARFSQGLYAELNQALDDAIEYRPKGSILAIETEKEMAVARDLVAKQQADGVPIRVLEREDALADEPGLAPDMLGSVECDSDASLSPLLLVRRLAAAVRAMGGRVCAGREVVKCSITREGGVDGVVTARNRKVAARFVVAAGGILTPRLGRALGLELPIEPRKGQIAVVEAQPAPARRKIMEFGYLMAKFGGEPGARDPELERWGVAFVYEPTVAGTVLLGSSREFAGFNRAVNGRVTAAIVKRAVRFLPVLARRHVIRSYAGLRPYTPDHFPIVSPTPVPGFYVAAGHEGDGISLAPATGVLIKEMILGEKPSLDLAPLAYGRFRKAGRAGKPAHA